MKPSRASDKPALLGTGVLQRLAWIAAILLPVFLAVRMPCIGVAMGLVILLSLGVAQATSGAYGSARFAEFDDLKEAKLVGSAGLILGRAVRRANFGRALVRLFTAPLSDSQPTCHYFRRALVGGADPETPLIRLKHFVHLMAVAPPGSGKGVGIVIPNLLTHPGSVVAIDPKGELYTATARVRRRYLGNRVVRLDPLGVCGPGGAKLNPLDFIDAKSPLVVDQCAALADALVVQTGSEADPHWNESAKVAVTAAALYVAVYAAPADRTLNAVADLLTDPDTFVGMVAMMRDQTGELAASNGHTPVYRLLQRYGNTMAAWQDRELASILSSVGRHLSWLHSQPIEEHLSQSDFDPRDLVHADVTVYLVLPPKYLSTLSRLLRLWVTTLYGAITETAQEKRQVLFMLDEAGNLGPMPTLFQAITLGRGYGVRVWLILQSIGQLKTLFPKEGEHQTAEASIDHRVIFGVRDYQTAEAVSNYLGTATVAVTSQTTSRGSSETGGSLAELLIHDGKNFSTSTNKGTSETRSEVSRKLMMPDEILQLPADSAIILAKGVPPILAKLARYFETPELADLLPETTAKQAA